MRIWIVVILACLAFACAARAADGPAAPRRALYVFAHQDDEMDVAAKIVTDLRGGADVTCVWVTDGSHGGPPDLREKESRAVMDLLGVPQDRLIFLGFEDQNTYKHLEEIAEAFLGVAKAVQPHDIMSHAYEGGNIDHDAVSLAASIAARAVRAVHYEFPDNNVYNGVTRVFEFLPDGRSETLYTPMDRDLFAIKMKTFRMYPTQAASLHLYELGMDKKKMKTLGEPYRVAPDYDYLSPPAAELRYEATSKGQATYAMWRDAVAVYFGN